MDWLERMKTEQSDLQLRIDKLSKFLYSLATGELTVSEEEVDLLNTQLNAMLIYNSMLKKRISMHT